jgi:hypothetical protein
MATYKVLQDIEAEDKLLGPLTLKQFIFATITVVCLYMSFFSLTKHAAFMLAILLPPALVAGFLAWPWSRDQPTEIWLLAKIRFFLKPRRRIWNQDGMQELVTITVPKKEEVVLTDNLSQTEVKSRLRALADTIDSRGWAIKNINANLSTSPSYVMADPTSDRLIDISNLPKEVPAVDVNAASDILDIENNPTAHHLDEMIGTSTKEHREQLMAKVNDLRAHPDQPIATPASQPLQAQDLWFMQPGAGQQPPGYGLFNSQVVVPGGAPSKTATTAEEKAIMAQLHPDSDKSAAAYGHMKVIEPKSPASPPPAPKPSPKDPLIQELARNDDLNISTIARQAKKKQNPPDDEVVVPLR